jgi:hypothetical protein
VATAQRPTWLHTCGGRGAFSVTRRGQMGKLALGILREGRPGAHWLGACANEACAASPPHHAAWCARMVRLGGGKGEGEGESGDDRWDPEVSESRQRDSGAGVLGCDGWAGLMSFEQPNGTQGGSMARAKKLGDV